MNETTQITLIEMSSQSDILANLINIEYGVNCAASAGAALIVLPENAFCFGNQALAAAQFDALANWASQLARRYHVYLLAGTLPCPYRPDGTKVPDGKFRQSALLFDPSGEQVARYDKIHLFKATVNDSTGSYDEGKIFEAGDEVCIAKTTLGNIGLMVCFDIRFAPLALRLRELGADILIAPSAFTFETGKAHWQKLLTARALDSQCLILGAGQHGKHVFVKNGKTHERHTWGHSQCVDANGEIISNVSNQSLDSIALCDFSLAKHAQSWLTSPSDITNDIWQYPDKLGLQVAQTKLITAQFEARKQQNYRESMPSFDNRRFDVIFDKAR